MTGTNGEQTHCKSSSLGCADPNLDRTAGEPRELEVHSDEREYSKDLRQIESTLQSDLLASVCLSSLAACSPAMSMHLLRRPHSKKILASWQC